MSNLLELDFGEGCSELLAMAIDDDLLVRDELHVVHRVVAFLVGVIGFHLLLVRKVPLRCRFVNQVMTCGRLQGDGSRLRDLLRALMRHTDRQTG